MSFIDDNVIKHCLIAIKQELKSKGIAYAELAKALEVSEITVKRMLNQPDIPLSRMISLCNYIGLDVSELLTKAQQTTPEVACFTEQQDAAFLRNPNLFQYFLRLLMLQKSAAKVAEKYDLDDLSTYLYLRKLENLGLIILLPENKIQLPNTRLTFDENSQFMREGAAWCFDEAAAAMRNDGISSKKHFGCMFLYKEHMEELMIEIQKVLLKFHEQSIDINSLGMKEEPEYQFILFAHPLMNSLPQTEVIRIKTGDLDD